MPFHNIELIIAKIKIKVTETKTQNIFKSIEDEQPDVVVIDSVQTLHTDYIDASPGSIPTLQNASVSNSSIVVAGTRTIPASADIHQSPQIMWVFYVDAFLVA